MRPHRHPHTFELLLPLRGRFVVLNFDDRGTVTHRAILGETCTVLEMAAGTWHAVLSLDTGGIIFEVKHGGYQPVAADDYAHWAPAEGEPGTTELMAWYAQAQVGDSALHALQQVLGSLRRKTLVSGVDITCAAIKTGGLRQCLHGGWQQRHSHGQLLLGQVADRA